MQERNHRFTSSKMPPASSGTYYPTLNKEPSPRHHEEEPPLIRFDDEPTNSFQNMRLYFFI